MTEFFEMLPDGKYIMRITTLKEGESPFQFPPGYSVVVGGKQFVVTREDGSSHTPLVRVHKAPVGVCKTCDEMRKEKSDFHPPHDASPRCESGKHNHCSCDTCF